MAARILLLVRAFLLWVVRPRTVALIAISLLILAVTYLLLQQFMVAVALKGFVTKTLPKLGTVAWKLSAKALAKKWLRQILFFFGGIFAFHWVQELGIELNRWLSRKKGEAATWWRRQSITRKATYVGTVLFLLWLPLGSSIFYFLPLVFLKDIALLLSAPLAKIAASMGITAVIKKLEKRLARYVPISLQKWWDKYTEWAIQKRRQIRQHFSNHSLVQKMEEKSRKHVERLVGKATLPPDKHGM